MRACFQYDSVQFVDEDLFRRLLPALVTQLAAFHPPDVLPLLAANEDASLAPAGGADGAAMWRAQDSAYGRAVVTALVELAVSCGSDTLWKPFNDEVSIFGSTMSVIWDMHIILLFVWEKKKWLAWTRLDAIYQIIKNFQAILCTGRFRLAHSSSQYGETVLAVPLPMINCADAPLWPRNICVCTLCRCGRGQCRARCPWSGAEHWQSSMLS